eukprot:15444640-Alexandrium_andersonii.AAC.1
MLERYCQVAMLVRRNQDDVQWTRQHDHIEIEAFGSELANVPDGDVWSLIAALLHHRGTGSLAVTKVKAHTDM